MNPAWQVIVWFKGFCKLRKCFNSITRFICKNSPTSVFQLQAWWLILSSIMSVHLALLFLSAQIVYFKKHICFHRMLPKLMDSCKITTWLWQKWATSKPSIIFQLLKLQPEIWRLPSFSNKTVADFTGFTKPECDLFTGMYAVLSSKWLVPFFSPNVSSLRCKLPEFFS